MTRGRLSGRRLGSLIGAIAALVFVPANADGLGPAGLLRVVGFVLFASAVGAVRRGTDDGPHPA